MFDNLAAFFDTSRFMPHGHCFLWMPTILWLHVFSDFGIALAYYAIPTLLFYLIRKRDDLPYKKVFVAFCAFILLCGTTHLLSIWVLWYPDYGLEGILKALTAITSVSAVFLVWKVVPQALVLINPIAIKQRGSENRIRALVNNALDGLITINMHGTIESFNPACEKTFGYQANEVIGQNIKILMPEPYHSNHDGYLKRYHETGQASIIGTSGREVRGKKKDGSVFPMELGVSAFELEDGQHYSGILRDITDRKKSEAELLHYTKELERSNQELDDFAYIASHDLKEPLRGLFNHATFLLEDYGDKMNEEGRRRLERLSYLAQRMERLVDDLLYFSRLGRGDLAIQSVDPNHVVHEIEQMMELLLLERSARILIPLCMPIVICDKPGITEIFRNLITNAIKHNDKLDRLVEVGFLDNAIAPHGAEKNVFYVKDNGMGIESDFHQEIFRIFKRLNQTETNEQGTGVGLTFVKKIIERHKGHIWLESTPGQGTTFYFNLNQGV